MNFHPIQQEGGQREIERRLRKGNGGVHFYLQRVKQSCAELSDLQVYERTNLIAVKLRMLVHLSALSSA